MGHSFQHFLRACGLPAGSSGLRLGRVGRWAGRVTFQEAVPLASHEWEKCVCSPAIAYRASCS